MPLSENIKWHSGEKSEYWNEQGIAYVEGINKPRSFQDATRCFEKAIELGDLAATYNLYILVKEQLVSSSKHSEQSLFDELVKNHIVTLNENDKTEDNVSSQSQYDKLTKSGLIDAKTMKDISVRSRIRVRAENIVNTLVPEQNDNSFKWRTKSANEKGLISFNEKTTLDEIWDICSGKMHLKENKSIEQYADEWARVLNRLEENIINKDKRK